MAITVRTGSSTTFDKTKLIPGELALVIDLGELYFCYSAGNIKQLQTREDLQELLDTSEEAYSALQQAITNLNNNTSQLTSLLNTQTEVNNARGVFANIKARLDASDALSATIANEKANTEYVDILATGKVDKGGNQQISLPMLAQEVITAMTGGSVAVVGDNSVNTSHIVRKSVTPNKASFFDIGLNRLDETTLKADTGIDGTGNEYVLAGTTASDFIYCFDCTNLYHSYRDDKKRVYSANCKFYFYNSAKAYLSTISGSTPYSGVAVPAGSYYVRITYTTNTFKRMLINGLVANALPYEQLKYKINNGLDSYVNQNSGTNLVDISKSVTGTITNTGNVSESASYKVSDFIQIKNGKTYTISSLRNLCFFTNASTSDSAAFISTAQTNYTFTATYDGFIRINYANGNESTLMCVEGSSIPTYYKPYHYILPETFLLNNAQVQQVQNIAGTLPSPLLGKKLLNFGDSIADGDGNGSVSYADMIAQQYGMTLSNYALGGATLGVSSQELRNQNITNQVDDAVTNGETPDIIFIEGGANDANNGVALGSITSGYSATYDKATTVGAFEYMISKLMSTYPNAKIIFVKVHLMGSRPLSFITLENTLHDVCKKWGIAVANVMEDSGLNTFLISHKQFTNPTVPQPDGDMTHPNAAGYTKFYVPIIKAKLNQSI